MTKQPQQNECKHTKGRAHTHTRAPRGPHMCHFFAYTWDVLTMAARVGPRSGGKEEDAEKSGKRGGEGTEGLAATAVTRWDGDADNHQAPNMQSDSHAGMKSAASRAHRMCPGRPRPRKRRQATQPQPRRRQAAAKAPCYSADATTAARVQYVAAVCGLGVSSCVGRQGSRST